MFDATIQAALTTQPTALAKKSATSAVASISAAVPTLATLATFAASRSVRVYQHMHRQPLMGKRLRLRRRRFRG